MHASSKTFGRNLPVQPTRLPWQALLWALATSAFFVVVYNGCNWVASCRASVPTLHFGWEHRIPFVPAMIVPYMSIDLLFFCSPLLCRDGSELRAHGQRLMLAMSIAAVFFLLFPLRMGFAHPPVGGFCGSLFRLLGGFDKPFNLVPSLHIALATLLWVVYNRRTRGLARLAVHAWFALIVLSAVLTYQHHLVDVAAGFALGALCLYWIPDLPAETFPIEVNRSALIGVVYASGAAACLAGAWLLQPWGLLLIWPAISLAVIASADFGIGPRVFRKAGGRTGAFARLILAPYIAGAKASVLYHRRQSEGISHVAPGLLLGGMPGREQMRALKRSRVTAVLDLTAEFSEPRPMRGLVYCNIPILDLTPPTAAQLRRGVDFIREQISAGGVVYVHCALGYYRSATIAAAYLLDAGLASTADEALTLIRRTRPSALAHGRLHRCLSVPLETGLRSDGSRLRVASVKH